MNYVARREELRSLLVEHELDGLVYGTGANLQYFSGLHPEWKRGQEPAEPDTLLLVSRSQPARVLAREVPPTKLELMVEGVGSRAQLVNGIGSYFAGRRIGVGRTAAGYLQSLVTTALPEAEVLIAEGIGEQLRLRKEADEVARLRRVVALTDRVMENIVDAIRPGVTQLELRNLIAETGRSFGADDVSFTPTAGFVKSGTQPTESPFVYPLDKGLEAACSIAFDFGFVLDGYCSDFGRSFYCGPAPEHIAGAYRALQEAQCHLIEAMRPGEVTLGQLFGIIERKLDELGYGDRLRARLADGTLGHQIGVDLHENPWIRPGQDIPLQPGMVMALEPKLWLPGEYYLRVEDIVLVTDDGAESLTAYDRELFELGL